MLKEKRLSQRIPVMLKVDYQIGSKTKTGFSANMSVSGLFMNVNEPVEIGSQIRMQFLLPGISTPISLTGMVIRSNNPNQSGDGTLPGVGIQFSEIAKTTREVLNTFLRKYQETPDSAFIYNKW